MATTAGGLPYPVGGDKVVEGDDAIKALADALEVRTAGAMFQGGQVIVTCNSAGGWGLTFPRPFNAGASPLGLAIDGGADGTGIRVLGVMTPLTHTGMSGVARDAQGGAAAANAAIRITYYAFGVAP